MLQEIWAFVRRNKRVLQGVCICIGLFVLGVYAGRISATEENVQVGNEQNVFIEETDGIAEEIPAEEPASDLSFEEGELEPGDSESGAGDEPTADAPVEEVLPEENLPTDWNLILVNATHVLPADHKVELGVIGSGHQIDKRAVEDYNAMEWDAKQAGCTVYVVSSYRTMEKQIELHHNKILEYVKEGYTYEEAAKKAATIVAIPGTSEHQLGLAVDMISADYKKLDQKQENTKGFQWLKEHSWEYGFILRYPNGKTDITGIIYEPWHFRYVGKEVAKEITERGITLEEYLGAHPVSAVLGEKSKTE